MKTLFRNRKHKLSLLLLSVLLLWTGCSGDEEEALKTSTGTASLAFEVRTRAAEDAIKPDEANQLTKLYVAERPQEHASDALHCAEDQRYTLEDGYFSLEGLFGQWYKFAFFCVPKWEGGGGEELLKKDEVDTHDFNKLYIDFDPVLDYQKENLNISKEKDLNIYRKIIDRWVDPESVNPPVENIVMERITGELEIDMGIPADQFERNVEYIELSLHGFNKKVYIHDQAAGEIIMEAESYNPNGGNVVFNPTLKMDEEVLSLRQKFHLCLLPQVLQGEIKVVFTEETAGGNTKTIKLGESEGETRIEVKPNQRTIVLYNGMEKDEFEVRYAGFNDQAVIDVEDDEWSEYTGN